MGRIEISTEGRQVEPLTSVCAPPVNTFCLPDPNFLSRYSAWDLDFLQIESGPMETKALLRADPDLALVDIQMNRRVCQRGVSPSAGVTFGLPLHPTLSSWRGKPLETNGLLNFGSGREFECVSNAEFNAFTISLSQRFLETLCRQSGMPFPAEVEEPALVPVHRRAEDLQEVMALCRRLLTEPISPFGPMEKEELGLLVLNLACDTEALQDRSRAAERARAVRIALELIHTQASDEELTIGGLCSAAGVSWRTLDRGFHETFGVGPKAYLNRLRLNRVRAELLRVRKSRKIVDVANDWGFWHMGQFAKDYRRMFGELPSSTASEGEER